MKSDDFIAKGIAAAGAILRRRGRCPRSGAKRNKYPWGASARPLTTAFRYTICRGRRPRRPVDERRCHDKPCGPSRTPAPTHPIAAPCPVNNAVCVIRRRDEGIAPYTITRGPPPHHQPHRGARHAAYHNHIHPMGWAKRPPRREAHPFCPLRPRKAAVHRCVGATLAVARRR